MPRVDHTFSVLACSAAFAVLPSVVGAQALPEPSAFFCGGALNAARIVHHVSGTAPTTESLKVLEGRSVAISHAADTATVTIGSQSVTIPWTKPANMICWNQPPGAVVLSTASSVSGDVLAVLGAVFQYRKQKPWPADYPAHINFDDTDVYVLQRRHYDYVSIADHHDRHFGKGVYVETCRYQEFYRVNPTTLEVLPYNGCLVGQPVQGLPDALQLRRQEGGVSTSQGLAMLIVLKYGGNAMAAEGSEDPTLDEVATLAARGDRVVLVHGGGPQIDAELDAKAIDEVRVQGLRVTGRATRDVVEYVLCGSVNKALVRALAARGARAVGISGQDGGLLGARRAGAVNGIDLGYVGEIAGVDPSPARALLDAGFVVVVAPLAVDVDGGGALNCNADTAAGALAGALAADAYVVITNVAGVRRDPADPDSVIARLTVAQAEAYLADGTFTEGMIPKIRAAIGAVRTGAKRAVVAGAGYGAIDAALNGLGTELAG